MEAPPEAGLERDEIWLLVKPLYGLRSAPRQFYNTVAKALKAAGFERSADDKAVFVLRNSAGETIGVVCAHVDDFLYGGNEQFHRTLQDGFLSKFAFGEVSTGRFTYVGVDVIQCPHTYAVRLSLTNYVRRYVEEVQCERGLPDASVVAEAVLTERSTCGGLLFVAN